MNLGDMLVCKMSRTMDCLIYGIEYGKAYKVVEMHHDEFAILVDDINLIWFTRSEEPWKNFPYYGTHFCTNIKEERRIKLDILKLNIESSGD